jgi:hypothetical protein
MKVRGTRECQDCSTRWSYYERASVECPECGSLRSVGVEEERQLHTATSAGIDLTPARNALDDGETLRRAAELAAEAAGKYTRQHGFVDGGELLPLEDGYLAAMELRTVADAVGRARSVDDEEEIYFLSLLRGADHGERPGPGDVPESLRDSRGLASANAVREYRADLRAYLDEHVDEFARDVLELLGTHVKRIRALDGDVPPAEAERLVEAARELGRYLRDGDEGALSRAEDRLDRLG